MAIENTNEPDLIHFATWDTWLGHELAGFASDVATTYRLLLLLRTLRRSAEDMAERAAHAQERLWHDFRKFGPPSPDWEMLADEWYHWWRKHGRRFPPLPGMAMGAGGWAGAPPEPEPEVEIQYLIMHPDLFIGPAEDVTVHRIEMASPGGFSFHGLGDPIRQMRELIKDLWYRNRQEQQRGELELLKQRLDLFTDHGLSPQQVFVLAVRILDNQQTMRELIESGKLALEGQERTQLENPKRRGRRPKEPPHTST